MVKQLIIIATFLLIIDTLEAIYCIRTILDFIMLAQYSLHNNKTLYYMDHSLYRLYKTKIAFENYCSINASLFWHTFNYPKFHTSITNFVKCIWDYRSTINYYTIYNEIVHKYTFKAFYRRTNKKEYKLWFLKYNIYYTNVITMQDVILIAKMLVGSTKKNHIIDTIDVDVIQVYSAINILLKYNWY